MAFCDYLLDTGIRGYNCNEPMVKGAEPEGLLINWDDIDWEETTIQHDIAQVTIELKCGGKKAYTITQNGKQPWNGTQQEMVEGAYQNTLTNTLQFAILKHDNITAEDIFALSNGKFVALVQNKHGGTWQVFGIETGLYASAMVRELYNDDTLSGWLATMVEEGATMSLFIEATDVENLKTATSACS